MSLLTKIRGWWRKDEVETAKEEAEMTQAERDVAEEDYEARKDDVAAERRWVGGTADYERDSEPPSRS
jgi:hypothetical protein